MAFNRFLIYETVDISNGDTAKIKNYYTSNGFVVLYASNNNAIAKITSGMRITGRSSGFSTTLKNWEYSNPENNMFYDLNYDSEYNNLDYITLDYPLMSSIHEDHIYNAYPHDIIFSTMVEMANNEPSVNVKMEILDFQSYEKIIQGN